MQSLNSAHTLLPQMRTLVSFATKYPATYMTICVIAGLTIRWYWAGQSLTRFFNPLFPFA